MNCIMTPINSDLVYWHSYITAMSPTQLFKANLLDFHSVGESKSETNIVNTLEKIN